MQLQGGGGAMAIVILEPLMTFKGGAPNKAGYDIFFVKLGLKDLAVFLPSSPWAGSGPAQMPGLCGRVDNEVPKLIILEDFNLPSLGLEF